MLDEWGSPSIVLTYLDKGIGAVLRAEFRLWDGTGVNPVAAIKITRHNLLRATALVHEAVTRQRRTSGGTRSWPRCLPQGWQARRREWPRRGRVGVRDRGGRLCVRPHRVRECRRAARRPGRRRGEGVALHPWRPPSGQLHPGAARGGDVPAVLRRRSLGRPGGGVDGSCIPCRGAGRDRRALLQASLPLLPRVAQITLTEPMRAFGGRPLAALVNPERVKPEALLAMEQQLGLALYTSMHWIWTEALRLLALTGLRIATTPEQEMATFARPGESAIETRRRIASRLEDREGPYDADQQ